MKHIQSQRDIFNAILRRDFAAFGAKCFNYLNPGTRYVADWHTKATHNVLDGVRKGYYNGLIIAQPPRGGKSIAGSVAFPAFLHGHRPSMRIIGASYSEALAIKHHNDYRTIVKSDWYKQLFPRTRIDTRKDTETWVELTRGGSRVATSVGGTLTGLGADLIIIDDPLKATDAYSQAKRDACNEWYTGTAVSRLNNKNEGAIIIIGQRLHTDDLIGHVISTGGAQAWEIQELSAIAQKDHYVSLSDNVRHFYKKGDVLSPERESLQVLENLRTMIGHEQFSAQYLQMPVPPGGVTFKRDWVRRYESTLNHESGDYVLQSWDAASRDGVNNDWSVCTTWLVRAGLYFLLDVFRRRCQYPDLKAAAIALGKQFSPRIVLVENASLGPALASELRLSGLNVKEISVKEGKEVRAKVQSAKFEGGRVYLPTRSSFLRDYEDELFAFPGGHHDDQVDSTVQALAYEHRVSRTTTTFYPLY